MNARVDAPTTPRQGTVLLASAALLFLAVACSGCAALGMAAVGPLVSAVQAVTDRSVDKTLSADLPTTSAVTLDTMSRVGLRVRDVRRADEAWTFEAGNEMLVVHGRLTRLSPSLTRVTLRVEVGSLSADKGTGDEILNQIAASLTSQSAASASVAIETSESSKLQEIEGELRRLRLEIEANRAPASRTTGRDDAEARERPRTGSGVISIPASYGVPTVAAPPPLDSAPLDRPGVTIDRSTAPAVLVAPLAPASGLRPIVPASETGSSGKK
jgi:hypothetical protein